LLWIDFIYMLVGYLSFTYP